MPTELAEHLVFLALSEPMKPPALAVGRSHLDTTRFALTGAYVPDTDEQAIVITHGYSKDHPPDLKQAVLEFMVSQDGGVPFVSKSWDGNTSDTKIFPGACPGAADHL